MITIKECQKDQLDLLFETAIQSYNDTYPYLWMDKGTWYLDEFYKKENFTKELSQSNTFYFLVYDIRKTIGYIKLNTSTLDSYPASYCTEIDKLYLLKGYTGKGIGNIIMEFIISLSRKQHRPVLWLKVMENSLAKYFYEKQGFIQTDKNYLDYPAMKEEYRSILTMVKEI
ncbi:GNAT family N-acetyltransferase [Flavobacterium sp. GT2N3]|uniref:GNAT family N-acetyltransferase n=1 Tax=unclassified Flavobacterium TaxID=196869 RepID=UPI003AAFE63E